jgi:hypothetical protein
MKPTKKEMLEWLEKNLDRSSLLQISHPHLAWFPTDDDRAMFLAIRDLIEKHGPEEPKKKDITKDVMKASKTFLEEMTKEKP